jgi:hypothetical protein
MKTKILVSTLLLMFLTTPPFAGDMTVREALLQTQYILYPQDGYPVDATVARELEKKLAPQAQFALITPEEIQIEGAHVLKISIADEGLTRYGRENTERDWMFFQIDSSGSGELTCSKPHLLYALFCRLQEEWLDQPVSQFRQGRIDYPAFQWLTGRDLYYGWRYRFSKQYDPHASIREIARMGCSHVAVNALAQPFPLEVNEPGEIYYRFYVSGPDFDQFVETDLNKGTYPPEYLAANLDFMKANADLAIKYGLTPGMVVANPRSVPQTLIERYPYLVGPRIDHPYRAYRPRYALTTAHPVVRWHYAEMLKKILHHIPQMGFMYTWLNDSGSGFEHTVRLYAGRNGGPYLIREWRSNEAFARAAAKNILRYYRTLRDAAREINPDFRIIAGLRAIEEEEDIILEGMENGLDTQSSVADRNSPQKWQKQSALRERGSYLHSTVALRINAAVLGIPFPWLAFSRLQNQIEATLDKVSIVFDPPSLAPYDINREVLKAFHLDPESDIDRIIQQKADQWVGEKHSSALVKAWKLADKSIAAFPGIPLYAGYGFIPNRLWVRPLVPDISNIPSQKRQYYEKYVLSVFNNPHNIDLNADALWEFLTVEEADTIVQQCDEKMWDPLNRAIALCENSVKATDSQSLAQTVLVDQHDRLVAARCYYRTLRNVAAWIAGVHGYLQADNEPEKKRRLQQVRDMIDNELQNMQVLLDLSTSSKTTFMPVFQYGETWFLYGNNFPELLQKKIDLMKAHKNDLPRIDPDYRWRMPADFPVEPQEYLKY